MVDQLEMRNVKSNMTQTVSRFTGARIDGREDNKSLIHGKLFIDQSFSLTSFCTFYRPVLWQTFPVAYTSRSCTYHKL